MSDNTFFVLVLCLMLGSCLLVDIDLTGEGARRSAYQDCIGLWNGEERKLKCAREIYGPTHEQ